MYFLTDRPIPNVRETTLVPFRFSSKFPSPCIPFDHVRKVVAGQDRTKVVAQILNESVH
jgi:hypothetical protein